MVIAIISAVIAVVLGLIMKWDRKMFILVTALVGICVAAAVMTELSADKENVTSIEKNEAGAGESIVNVEAVTDTGENVEIALTVPERSYTVEEKK